MADMMQAGGYGSLQLLRNQGLFHHNCQGARHLSPSAMQRAIRMLYLAHPHTALLLCRHRLQHAVQPADHISQTILPLTGGLPHGEVVAQTRLVFVIVPLILLGAEGTNREVQIGRATLRTAPAHLLSGFTDHWRPCRASARGRSSEPAALAEIFLASMTTVGVAVGGRMFKHGPLVPAIPEVVPEVPAIPTIPAAVEALPIFPVVEGEYDIDDVLGRPPTPTRLNSPLSWL